MIRYDKNFLIKKVFIMSDLKISELQTREEIEMKIKELQKKLEERTGPPVVNDPIHYELAVLGTLLSFMKN